MPVKGLKCFEEKWLTACETRKGISFE